MTRNASSSSPASTQLTPLTPPSPTLPPCAVCGGGEYRDHRVLWPTLVQAWNLSPEEEAYVNRQQGTVCLQCGGNLRSIALARAICRYLGHPGTLDALLDDAPDLALLEVNEAGTLHPRLSRFPGHVFAGYPQCDMMALPFDTGRFRVVVHSDTLEHVADPSRALAELRRVLAPGGASIFTVPIVVGRMTRSRRGLPPSHHGDVGTDAGDLLVHNEFGCDVWTLVLQAGFSRCDFVPFGYPAGIAMVAHR